MASAYQVDTFIKTLRGGARGNHYWVIPASGTKTFIGAYQEMPILTNASSFPGRAFDDLGPKYKGRTAALPGDTTFDDWAVTAYLTPDHSNRRGLLAWQNLISDAETNYRSGEADDYDTIYRDFLVLQATTEGVITSGVKIVGGYPNAVGPVSVGNDVGLLNFEVTFKYQYWKEITALEQLGNLTSILTAINTLPTQLTNVSNISQKSVENFVGNLTAGGSDQLQF